MPVADRVPFTVEQRLWFGLVFVVGVLYAFVLPPFQGNDEDPHWIRTWAVARGQVRCVDVPKGAIRVMEALPYHAYLGEEGKLRYQHVRDALKEKPAAGTTTLFGRHRGACGYWPLPYLLPALVVSGVAGNDSSEGAMIRAFWAARIAGWATLCAAVLVAAMLLPWARNTLLAFLSIPMVVQQGTVLNTDLLLFLLMFVLLAAVLRKPSWRGIAAISVAVVCMTMTKPIYATLGMVAFPALVELWHTGERRRPRWQMAVAFLALFAAPILLRGAWATWLRSVEPAGRAMPIKDIRPAQQIGFLLHHPLHIATLFWHQLQDSFSHDLVRGSWRSIIAALGSSTIELSPADYVFMLVSLAAAMLADQVGPARPPELAPASAGAPVRRWAWAGALVGIAIVIPAAVLAMYVYYTPWEGDRVEGVQGRYYLIPLLMLALCALSFAKQRWPRERPTAARLAGAVALCLAMIVDVHALEAVAWHYWRL